MPMTWTMNRRALRLKERSATAYSAMSDRACMAATLPSAAMRRLLPLICILAIACSGAATEREVTVGMKENALLPNTIELTAAKRVRITVRNPGRTKHAFAPDQRGVALGLS